MQWIKGWKSRGREKLEKTYQQGALLQAWREIFVQSATAGSPFWSRVAIVKSGPALKGTLAVLVRHTCVWTMNGNKGAGVGGIGDEGGCGEGGIGCGGYGLKGSGEAGGGRFLGRGGDGGKLNAAAQS